METIAIQTDSANLTEEQFFRLCVDNKELRIERDKNKNIIIMSPTGALTGKYNFSIAMEIGKWNEKNKMGHIFDSSAGFTLPDYSVFSPDVAWILKKRWEKIPLNDKEKFAHICPDFVIEIRSKRDSLKAQKEKMLNWIENGCRLAWLIDIEHKTTHIYKPGAETTTQSFTKILSGETVLPGFKLKISEII